MDGLCIATRGPNRRSNRAGRVFPPSAEPNWLRMVNGSELTALPPASTDGSASTPFQRDLGQAIDHRSPGPPLYQSCSRALPCTLIAVLHFPPSPQQWGLPYLDSRPSSSLDGAAAPLSLGQSRRGGQLRILAVLLDQPGNPQSAISPAAATGDLQHREPVGDAAQGDRAAGADRRTTHANSNRMIPEAALIRFR
jgi:hypothetical protein